MDPCKRQDDPQSLAEFVSLLTRHQPDLLAFIISQMPGDPDAPDVLQASNLVLWNKRNHFQAASNFLSWAFAIARYEVLNHLKKRKRRRVVLLDSELLETLAAEAPAVLHDGDSRMRALENCLAKLRQEDRDLLKHRYQSGLGLDRFAERVGRSISALSVSLNRLRIALRHCMAKTREQEGGAW